MNYDWHFSRLIPYAGAFAYGTLMTVVLTTLIIVLGTTIGVILGGFVVAVQIAKVVFPRIERFSTTMAWTPKRS